MQATFDPAFSEPIAPQEPSGIRPVEPRPTPKKGRVLIVDDEANSRDALARSLATDGFETRVAVDAQHALAVMEAFEPDVVLTDLCMPGGGGIALIEAGKQRFQHTVFVVMTAFGSIDSATEAIKKGAESYVTKPVDLEAMSALAERLAEMAQVSREAAHLREVVSERYSLGGIVGSHPAMQRLLKQVSQVAASRATVLIEGETGTGKELIAIALHQNSGRSGKPFVRLNCAALAESVLESELFGHERGSFTGATRSREGRLEQADGGTLFLDEISEISQSVQVKLLRFLQEREIERVGSNETRSLDVRVIAATNRDLSAMVDAGEFRKDLYYRLNVVTLKVPPLRARKSDIPALAHAFLRRFSETDGRRINGFTKAAMRWLVAAPWPGNVRQLENAIERAVVLCSRDVVDIVDFPDAAHQGESEELDLLVPGASMQDVERVVILRTLEAVAGSTSRAAQILGISRRKIQYRLKEWGLSGEDFRELSGANLAPSQ